tara:strand:+ start:167 stop:1186 length:1020 start_codon:yes stop_codon:yes gene_type:complete
MIGMDKLISNQIRKKNLIVVFEKHYNKVNPLWSNHQLQWINGVFGAYKDHDKYLIVLYLIKKTFDYYSNNLVLQSYTEYFENNSIEIDEFNVMEVSKALNIPKESARRKINELDKLGVIKRTNNRIFIDKFAFLFVKPELSITRISRFLSNLSDILYNEKILKNETNTIEIKNFIEKYFSIVWKIYYELQIPMMLGWKKIFKDIETFHIWAVCVVNQTLNSQRDKDSEIKKKEYLGKYFFNTSELQNGINAMSISDISGIPRATVIRKLNILVKKNYLNIDNKKHYTLASTHQKLLVSRQMSNFSNLATFVQRVFNLFLIDKKSKKENIPMVVSKKYLY